MDAYVDIYVNKYMVKFGKAPRCSHIDCLKLLGVQSNDDNWDIYLGMRF